MGSLFRDKERLSTGQEDRRLKYEALHTWLQDGIGLKVAPSSILYTTLWKYLYHISSEHLCHHEHLPSSTFVTNKIHFVHILPRSRMMVQSSDIANHGKWELVTHFINSELYDAYNAVALLTTT
jgi:hypothetical protein